MLGRTMAFVRSVCSLDSFGGASGDRDPGRLGCGVVCVCWGGGGGRGYT